MEEISQLVSYVCFILHWKMGGTSQAAVSIAKCLSELHAWRALRQSLIFARSTSRDAGERCMLAAKLLWRFPVLLSPVLQLPHSFHHTDTRDGGLFLTQIISTWCL